ncbi:MAG: response regulator [Candidatus Nealsonbacteria bacterium DGGOD1a]|nr:MAG: response regulator [Candidatus Nealsonbacteria bacterium DGGOD1a]
MKKIILVESEPVQINLYRRMFEHADFEVELASSKDEMLEELRQIRNGNSSKPDLVVLDFMLVDGHGIEILKAMKKNFITRGIPVFAVTNYQNPDLDRQINHLGIKPEKYLIKAHYNPAELLEIMNDYFENSHRVGTTLS